MPLFDHLDAVAIFNAVEAAWWFLVSMVVAVRGGRMCGFTIRTRVVAALLLAAFGVSDLVEMQTGAWWRPPGLLFLKAVCVGGLIACGVVVLKRRRDKSD